MEDAKDTLSEIKKLLEEKRTDELVIKGQEKKLTTLRTHKKTLVSMLVEKQPSWHYPLSISNLGNTLVTTGHDFSAFYLLNVGNAPNGIYPSHFGELQCPVNYKLLRRFIRHRTSRSVHSEILYLSLIIERNNRKYYVIKDDENNVWKGENIMPGFTASFDIQLPFNTVEEWFALHTAEVGKYTGSLNFNITPRSQNRPFTLPEYFMGM